MNVLGIDPGWSGALAFLDPDTRDIVTYDLPTITRGNGKTYVDLRKVIQLLEHHKPDEAWLEDVYSSPQMGVVGAFSFGQGKGALEGILAALDVPTRYVAPATWKKALGLTVVRLEGETKAQAKKRAKALAKAKARALFPKAKGALSNEGKCEATLIAQYGALAGGKV